MPAIVSMIPGKAEHYIKSIVSSLHSVTDIIKGFLTLEDLAPSKVFRIDEITGVTSEAIRCVLGEESNDNTTITLHDVRIKLSSNAKHPQVVTFMYNNKQYELNDVNDM
jgi:hypothetical protein